MASCWSPEAVQDWLRARGGGALNSPEVAAGGGLRGQPRVDLQHVGASVVVVVGASWPHFPRSSTCARCRGGSAISDTHDWPGGVASACRTQCFLLTSQRLKANERRRCSETSSFSFHVFLWLFSCISHKRRGFMRTRRLLPHAHEIKGRTGFQGDRLTDNNKH